MKRALNVLGYPVGRRKAPSLMREAGVLTPLQEEVQGDDNSNHKKPLFGNILQRESTVEGPDLAYVLDITYIWAQQGWLYLAVFIDPFSLQVTSSQCPGC